MKHWHKWLYVLSLMWLTSAAFAQSITQSTRPALVDPDGKSTSLDQYRGKVVLLNFWATWCAPCRLEMPELNQLSRQLDLHRAVVVGVAADERKDVKTFVTRLGIRYPIAIGDTDQIFAWSVRLGNRSEGLPFSVLLDTKGKVVWQQEGGGLKSAKVLDLIQQQLSANR
jgi:thiol-disulfide isomerase/thioredoxin